MKTNYFEIMQAERQHERNKFDFFRGLDHMQDRVFFTDWVMFTALVEKHAIVSTGNPHIFRHDVMREKYTLMFAKWYKRSSFGSEFKKHPVGELEKIVSLHRFSLEDIEMLLDVMEETMTHHEMYEIIPSIHFGKEYIHHLKIQRDQKILGPEDVEGKISNEWNKVLG